MEDKKLRGPDCVVLSRKLVGTVPIFHHSSVVGGQSDLSDLAPMLSVEMHRTLLETKLSIPRANIHKCDNCGDRDKRKSLSDVHTARPHSVHVDQDNYLYLQHINEVRGTILVLSRP